MKLQLLGEENVGKTSLARYLTLGINVSEANPNLSTNGVEIGSTKKKERDDDDGGEGREYKKELIRCISAWETGKTLKRWRYYCNQCFKSTDQNTGGPAQGNTQSHSFPGKYKS